MSRMFVPGPVDVAPEVLAAIAKPVIPHRSKEYETIFHRAAKKCEDLFYTKYRVFIGTHSGSGMQETGIRSLVQKDVLCCINGAFSKRWYDVAVANGKQADKLEAEWGKAIEPDQLREALKKKHYEAITVVHNETSTGCESPVKDLCAVVQEVSPDTLVLVDAVSSLAGTKIEMDAWGIDFLLTSAQKCLALPPGISLAGTNDRALEKAKTVKNRGWYFDLVLMEKYRTKNTTAMTSAVNMVYGLDFQLDRIFEEGLENRFARHAAMSKRVYDWSLEHGMEPFADPKYLSKTVATVKNKIGMDISKLNAFLLERGMRIANGYGDLKNQSFRIATMGETQMEDIEELLGYIEEFMK